MKDAREQSSGRVALLEEALGARGRSVSTGGPLQKREGGRLDVVVIGAGQSGLSVGYHLARRGLRFVILEGDARVGDVWRRRWDSLRLFTPARYDGLDGMPFPAPPHTSRPRTRWPTSSRPTRRASTCPSAPASRSTASRRQAGPLSSSTPAARGSRPITWSWRWRATSSRKCPPSPGSSPPSIVQLHSREYRNPASSEKGDVLIVGAGNSGAEIAMELAPRHQRRWGRAGCGFRGGTPGIFRFRIDGPFGRRFFVPLVLRFLFHHV